MNQAVPAIMHAVNTKNKNIVDAATKVSFGIHPKIGFVNLSSIKCVRQLGAPKTGVMFILRISIFLCFFFKLKNQPLTTNILVVHWKFKSSCFTMHCQRPS